MGKGGRGEARSGFEKSLIEIGGKEVKVLCDEETEVVDFEDWKEDLEEMVDLETEKK